MSVTVGALARMGDLLVVAAHPVVSAQPRLVVERLLRRRHGDVQPCAPRTFGRDDDRPVPRFDERAIDEREHLLGAADGVRSDGRQRKPDVEDRGDMVRMGGERDFPT